MLLLATFAAGVHAADEPRALFEAQCQRCHREQPADFARKKLALVKGKLVVKRSGADIDGLLSGHYGAALSAAEAEGLKTLLKSGAR